MRLDAVIQIRSKYVLSEHGERAAVKNSSRFGRLRNKRKRSAFFECWEKTGRLPAKSEQTKVGDIAEFFSVFVIVLPDVQQNVQQQTADSCVSYIFSF